MQLIKAEAEMSVILCAA